MAKVALPSQATQQRVDLTSLAQAHFDSAKAMWWASLWCKAATAVISMLALFFSPFAQLGYIAVGVLTFFGELFTFYSDKSKGKSEMIRRELDLVDSFGGNVSRKTVADLQAETRERILRKLPAEGEIEPYFSSTEPPGAHRALENLLESSWWSRRLTHIMSSLYWAITCVVVALAILLLVGTLAIANSVSGIDMEAMAKLGIFVIALISSLGLVRQLTGYGKFENSAALIEDSTEHLLEAGSNDPVEVLRLWQTYHLARAGAPLIPSLIWELQRKRLNRLWMDCRKPRIPTP